MLLIHSTDSRWHLQNFYSLSLFRFFACLRCKINCQLWAILLVTPDITCLSLSLSCCLFKSTRVSITQYCFDISSPSPSHHVTSTDAVCLALFVERAASSLSWKWLFSFLKTTCSISTADKKGFLLSLFASLSPFVLSLSRCNWHDEKGK